MRSGKGTRCGWMMAALVVACHRSDEINGGGDTNDLRPSARQDGRLDEHRTFGPELCVENLQVWPILTDRPADVGDFLTLQAAQEQGVAEVQEIKEGARVNTLEIESRSDRPILVCAGTLVKGGQQDRQIGQDFVVLGHSTVAVDAFCVEHGRWSGSAGFCATRAIAVASVRASGQYRGNQQRVWEEVADANAEAAACPDTGTLLPAEHAGGPGVGPER